MKVKIEICCELSKTLFWVIGKGGYGHNGAYGLVC